MEKNEEKIEAEILESNVKEEKNNTINDDATEQVKTIKDEEINEEANTATAVEKKVEEPKEEKAENSSYDFKQKKRPDYRELKEKRDKKNHRILISSIIVVSIIIIGLLASTIFALLNSNNNKIMGGISIDNISVEGLTDREAIKLLNEKIEEKNQKEFVISINGATYTITPEQIQLTYNIEKAVENAYNIGRDGNIFQNNFSILQTLFSKNNIELEYTYNEELLDSIIKDIGAKLPNVMIDNSYYIEENELIINRGTAGVILNVEETKALILANITKQQNSPLEIEPVYSECPEIDIEKIYSEVKTEPQDAYYTTDPFEIIPHKNGIDFDLEKAKEVLKEEKDEYIIKLKIIEPEILTNEIGEEAFPNLLSSFSTKYDESNVSRSKNLKIAMSKLDGVVIMPGEVFSYNKTLGKRTVEEGYQYANGFAGGKVVPMLAGGICQISSTLYDAALYANLNIVERHNHMFQAGYVEAGKDATVVYGSLDLKFENTRKYPIMLKTKAGGGLAEIRIFGIKEDVEYEVEIVSKITDYVPYKVVYENDSSLAPGVERVSQYGLQGCRSTTYRILKLNGQEVSREVLSTDTYDALNKIVRRGATATTQPVEDIPAAAQPISDPIPVPTSDQTVAPTATPSPTVAPTPISTPAPTSTSTATPTPTIAPTTSPTGALEP